MLGAAEIEFMHRQRTGRVDSRGGARWRIIASTSESELEAVTDYAINLGLLFQITDDLLDVTATAEDLGKTPGGRRALAQSDLSGALWDRSNARAARGRASRRVRRA